MSLRRNTTARLSPNKTRLIPQFENLRETIYTTTAELIQFRQLVVNTVMATDIFDPDLAKNRLARWKLAFESCDQEKARSLDDVGR